MAVYQDMSVDQDMDIELYEDIFDENEKLGKILQEKYNEPTPQNRHIDYFYLILGHEYTDRRAEIKALIEETPGIGQWDHFNTEWKGLLIGELPPIQNQTLTEREREERLNTAIRQPLLERIPQDPNNPIILSRVCKYTNEVTRPPTTQLTTTQIERALKDSYPEHTGNQHIDYFYLIIRLKHIPTAMDIPAILSDLPGEWVPVTPGQTWPLTFIGYFPRLMFESERAREWRLHCEVRQPLKDKLREIIKKESPNAKKAAIVLFTRACQYTKM